MATFFLSRGEFNFEALFPLTQLVGVDSETFLDFNYCRLMQIKHAHAYIFDTDSSILGKKVSTNKKDCKPTLKSFKNIFKPAFFFGKTASKKASDLNSYTKPQFL